MAVAAGWLEYSTVDGWFRMAARAFRRRVLERLVRLLGLAFIGVALHTADQGVFFFEPEG